MQAAASEKNSTKDRAIWRKVVLLVLVATGTAIVLAAWLNSALKSQFLAWDFPQFYTSASLPVRLIYNQDAFSAFGLRHLAPLGVRHFPPYVARPAVFALLYRPLALFPYWTAFGIWAGLCLCAYFAATIILIRRLRLPAYLIPAYAGFFPAIVGLISGQDACVVLLVLVSAWVLLDQQRDWLAGALIALCLYKYNLVLLIPLLLVIKRRFRALTSFGIGAIILTTASVALASPREYINLLIADPKLYSYFRVGLVGFSRAIGQPWCYPVLAVIALAVCCWLMRRLPMTEAFSTAIVGMLLISPHIAFYDSTLLTVPIAVVFARSGPAMRVICLAILVIQWLWVDSSGPIGFTHTGVELFILGYFVSYARQLSRTSQNREAELRAAAA